MQLVAPPSHELRTEHSLGTAIVGTVMIIGILPWETTSPTFTGNAIVEIPVV